MAETEGSAPVLTGFAETDQLIGDALGIGEKIRAQAETLSALSTAALTAIGSPVRDHYLQDYWPFTSAPILQKLLMARARANLTGGGQEKPSTGRATDEQPADLSQSTLWSTVYGLADLASIYERGSASASGYPPTGITRDLIKWSVELANNDWLVLAKIDIAKTPGDREVGVSVYPETPEIRDLLDQETRVKGEYTATQWLSERVIMHAHSDEFARFDWVGEEAAT